MSDDVVRRPGGRQIIPRPADWSPGPPAPWLTGAAPSLDRLLSNLSTDAAPVEVRDEAQRPAAVLVVLHQSEQGPEVLLTRRSWQLSSHRGEMSFPGGRMDPGETPTQTALREANEEVGLDPADVRLHGELDHFSTFASKSYIVPKVATVERRPELAARTIEVDRILWVPLNEFVRADTYRSEHWHTVVTEGELHFFELDDETVWGVTASMMMDLLARALG